MKRILITRPRAQADAFAEELRLAGFEPVFFPVIEIQPMEDNVALERAVSRLGCYDWVVFTSVNAVEVVCENHASAFQQERKNVKFAAVGPKTAEALQARGITPDFVPDEYIAEMILSGLGDLRGKWVLLPRAEMAHRILPQAIFEAGGIPHEVTVYKTLPAQPEPTGLAALQSGVDVIMLTSASTVHNLVRIVREQGLDPLSLPGNPLFLCIGPITEQTAREERLVPLVTAGEYTTKGMIEALRKWEVS